MPSTACLSGSLAGSRNRLVQVTSGLERLLAGAGSHLKPLSLGLIIHPASVTRDFQLSVDTLLQEGFSIKALFGPQHGARGEKQDNMIESGHYADPYTGLPVHSLYSNVRKPTPEMLSGLDAIVFDLQDVGVRVYTFIWTMLLAMEACAEIGIRFIVLDRPNPIGGIQREGAVLRKDFESFVGLHPIPLRHGLTCGELATWMNETRGIGCELEIIECRGWRRSMGWSDTGLPWVAPSPNLPTPVSCLVYPGMVLLEGTNLSEGRGTTKPFEYFGAPYLNIEYLLDLLGQEHLDGVMIRPCHFEPTFQKYAGTMCAGGQLHVTDPATFQPVRTAVTILRAARELAPREFSWSRAPYEYEENLMPIDLIWGHDGLRHRIDDGATVDEVLEGVQEDLDTFKEDIRDFLIYQ
ncbi:MAG: hypothetical protein CME17_02605 [Gemmatimonadetes bacterium]|nr:hypothetical protein [Gemmatimonadota bacterium]